MGTKARGQYTGVLKREALAWAALPGQTLAGIAKDLGVSRSALQRWQREQLTLN